MRDDPAATEARVMNLDPKGHRTRRNGGVVMLPTAAVMVP